MKVSKGLATYAGLVAALGQYAAAVAVFLEASDQSVALGPLVTATATLLAVIVGRMQQAKALAAKPAGVTVTGDAAQLSRAVTDVMSGKIGGNVGLGTASKGTGTVYAYPTGKRALGEPTDLSLEIPGGGFPQDGERP